MQTYQCLEDRVLIKPIVKKEVEKTDGGILLGMVKKETAEGLVINVGVGKYAPETGVFIPTVLGEGDIILYGVHAGMPLDVPDEGGKKIEMRIMRESDILLLIKKSE